jgi:hypothetical protein
MMIGKISRRYARTRRGAPPRRRCDATRCPLQTKQSIRRKTHQSNALGSHFAAAEAAGAAAACEARERIRVVRTPDKFGSRIFTIDGDRLGL